MKTVFAVCSLLIVTFLVEAKNPKDTIQKMLNHGTTPKELIEKGVPRDALYGKVYQGGYIFYFFPGDSTGLVMGKKDLFYHHDTTKGKIIWGCRNVETGATGTAIGTGPANTKKILEATCSLYDPDTQKWMKTAARLVNEYKYHKYDDWYLPSKDELHEAVVNLCHNKRVYFGEQKEYWTSSEESPQFAWVEHFKYGPQEYPLFGQSYFRKFFSRYLRPVRTFR